MVEAACWIAPLTLLPLSLTLQLLLLLRIDAFSVPARPAAASSLRSSGPSSLLVRPLPSPPSTRRRIEQHYRRLIIAGDDTAFGVGVFRHQSSTATKKTALRLSRDDDNEGNDSGGSRTKETKQTRGSSGSAASTSTLDSPSNKNKPSSYPSSSNGIDDDEKEGDVVGAKFFGGSAQKEELYDPLEEERADALLKRASVAEDEADVRYKRFDDVRCFEDDLARKMGLKVQSKLNEALYDEHFFAAARRGGSGDGWNAEEEGAMKGPTYASNLRWDTPFNVKDPSSTTPINELLNALSFYNRIDVAVVAGRTVSSSSSSSSGEEAEVELRWELSVVWPNPWESRVLLTGTSRLTVDVESLLIRRQIDALDDGGPNDALSAVSAQLWPRFWDVYHIGMTPSAELSPRLTPTTSAGKKGFLSPYQLMELPPRLVLRPTLLDSAGRDGRVAQALPNHAFATVVKTMGPNKQRYVTTSPVEVMISRATNEEKVKFDGVKSRVTWSVPVPPEVLSNVALPVPLPEEEDDGDENDETDGDDSEEEGGPTVSSSCDPSCPYEYRPRRLVATLPYGGSPQDEDVSTIRKALYEAVVKDGLVPQLDDDGRPKFFFWQNDAKACFTGDGGLGMVVYEWRPDFVKCNEVGIELEL